MQNCISRRNNGRIIAKKVAIFFPFLAFLLSIAACENEPPPEQPTADFAHGVYLCAEGVFSQTSGTITHYNPSNQEVRAGACLFRSINGRDLGNVVQSLSFHGDKVYIIVNNSNKIEVANANTWVEEAQILGLAQPRYALPISSRTMYVSQWGNDGLTGEIKVIQTPENQVISTLSVPAGAEQFLLHQNTVWVAHTGGYGHDNRLTIIDTSTHSVLHTISLPADVPNSLQKDAQNRIWVACSGKTIYSTYPNIDTSLSSPAALLCIDPNTRLIHTFFTLEYGGNARNLQINSQTQQLFYLYKDGVYAFDIAQGLTTRILDGNFYGLGFDAARNELYAAKNNGISPAEVFRINTSGAAIDTITSGAFTNAAVFR
jgi:hypothetical protein